MVIEVKKTKIKMNKPIYFGMSILDINKTLMYEFWFEYIKPKYQGKAKLCCMDTGSFVIYNKTEDFYEDIANDAEEWFDISNSKVVNRQLPIGWNKKVVGIFKNELEGMIVKGFVGPREKILAYLLVDDSEHKAAKGTEKCIIKRGFTYKTYTDCLLNN